MNLRHRVERGQLWEIDLEYKLGRTTCISVEAMMGGGAEAILRHREGITRTIVSAKTVKSGDCEVLRPLEGYKTKVAVEALHGGGASVEIMAVDGELVEAGDDDRSHSQDPTPYRKPPEKNSVTPEGTRLLTSLLNVVPAAVDWGKAYNRRGDGTIPPHETERLGRRMLSAVKPACDYARASSDFRQHAADNDVTADDVVNLLASGLSAFGAIFNACKKE